jgi:hypothetical protein
LLGVAGDGIHHGGSGDDLVFSGAGNDPMIWNPPDGSDLKEGRDGNHTFNVQGSHGRLTLDAGFGTETINVGSTANTLDPIQGPVSVLGALGGDTLNINDQGSTTPDGIRGKEVRIQVHYRSMNPFGPAVEIHDTKVEVWKE